MPLDLDFNWDNYFDNQPLANKPSQSSSSHNGLSNPNGSSSSHNGSQSSSSNADWMRAHSGPQSSSSHNGLSNSSNNGLQAMREDASHSSSSSDVPQGKGEKRKLDEEDKGDGAKRAKKE